MSIEGNMRILPLALLITMFVLGGSANADPLPKRVLIVPTNTAQVRGSDRPTGVWASEYTDPYQVFSRPGSKCTSARQTEESHQWPPASPPRWCGCR